MIGLKRTMVSVLVSLMLVGTAVTSVWLMASAGVFTGDERALPGAPVNVGTVVAAPAGTIAVAPGFQVGQPRDPFEPLVTSPSDGGGETTTTTTGTGDTTTTAAGGRRRRPSPGKPPRRPRATTPTRSG